MSFKISKTPVSYFPESGDVARMNPIPERAKELRVSQGSVARASGIGRIDYEKVLSLRQTDISDFAKEMGIKGSLLAGNTKTDKERVDSGRLGVIKGLSLVPHYYPNFLNKAPLVKGTDRLADVDRVSFNTFAGRTKEEAAESSGVEKLSDLLNFCTGSSPYCRSSCLIFTGQNPISKEAANSKIRNTYSFLLEPELFVGLLRANLISFAQSSLKKDIDPVVRLNILSDIPWYEICPELLIEMADDFGVVWYDYTKLPFWKSKAYKDVEDILDLTFSFAGNNEKLCQEALNGGYRVATVFAPVNPDREAGVNTRTSFNEIVYLAKKSGLLRDGYLDMFGGSWELVDGDSSDYRIDDPAPSIVSLNFKQPSVGRKEGVAYKEYERLWEAIPEARQKFSKQFADPDKLGEFYSMIRRKDNFLKFLAETSGYAPDKDIGKELLEDIDVEDVFDIYDDYVDTLPRGGEKVPRGNPDWRGLGSSARKAGQYAQDSMREFVDGWQTARRNPLEIYKEDDPSEPMDEQTNVAMFPIEGTGLMVGPHVPTILDD